MAIPNVPAIVPLELVRKAAIDGESDASGVAALLEAAGFEPPVRLPAALLLGLGAAMRVAAWEAMGHQPHRAAGLPDARKVVLNVVEWCRVLSPADRDRAVVALHSQVTEISRTQFAWEGPDILGADTLVGEPQDDVFLDALAEFVWQHRHGGTIHGQQDKAGR